MLFTWSQIACISLPFLVLPCIYPSTRSSIHPSSQPCLLSGSRLPGSTISKVLYFNHGKHRGIPKVVERHNLSIMSWIYPGAPSFSWFMLQYCRHLPTESLRRGGLTHCKCALLQSCKLSSARCSMRMTIALFKCWIVYELTRTGKGVTVVTTGRLVDWPTTARARMPHTPITPHFFWMLSPSDNRSCL